MSDTVESCWVVIDGDFGKGFWAAFRTRREAYEYAAKVNGRAMLASFQYQQEPEE